MDVRYRTALIVGTGPVVDLDPADVQRAIAISAFGAFLVARDAPAPQRLELGGRTTAVGGELLKSDQLEQVIDRRFAADSCQTFAQNACELIGKLLPLFAGPRQQRVSERQQLGP